MKLKNRYSKLILFVFAGVILLFSLNQANFLVTKIYSGSILDFFGPIGIFFSSATIIVLTVITIGGLVNNKTLKYTLIFTIISYTSMTSYFIRSSLVTEGLQCYRKDLGITAVYLYLNDSGNYILRFTYPFGHKTMVGEFQKKESMITFDKKIDQVIGPQIGLNALRTNSLNLQQMDKIN